jgi:hypothetical protein
LCGSRTWRTPHSQTSISYAVTIDSQQAVKLCRLCCRCIRQSCLLRCWKRNTTFRNLLPVSRVVFVEQIEHIKRVLKFLPSERLTVRPTEANSLMQICMFHLQFLFCNKICNPYTFLKGICLLQQLTSSV